MRNRTILVTGGTGFIAYYIALALLVNNDINDAHNIVLLMVRNMDRALKRYGNLIQRNDLKFLIQDVREKVLCNYMRIDYIIHAAMTADPNGLDNNPRDVFETAVDGTKNIIDFAVSQKVKSIVYLSSVMVYGGINTGDVLDEDYVGNEDWKKDRSCYSYGKRNAEFLCLVAYRRNGLPVKIIRPGYIYGVGNLNDTRVYAEIVRNAALGKPIILKSNGLLKRSMIYVTDLVRAVMCVMVNGVDGESYNVASCECSIRQFAETAVKVSNDKKVYLMFENESDAFVHVEGRIGGMSCDKIERECNYVPIVEIENGIEKAIKIFVEENRQFNI